MKVRAINMCFVGGARRRPGDIFDAPDSLKSKDCEPVGGAEKPAPKKKEVKEEPTTFSALNKTTPKGAELI